MTGVCWVGCVAQSRHLSGEMLVTISARHPPRKRGSQYAAASRLDHDRLWNTGSPAFAGDDSCVFGERRVNTGSPHAALVFASWIARQTRSGVSGMLISLTPYSDSASSTALTMVERLPAQPASPQPLVPSGLDLAGTG